MKVPQSVTHEKALAISDTELTEFLRRMDVLGTKLGPTVLQFPFFNRSALRDRHEFLDRLVPFLAKLPNSYKFAIEIRNRNWLDAEFVSLLRDRSIALVLQDQPSRQLPLCCAKNSIWLPSDGDVGTCFFGFPSLET